MNGDAQREALGPALADVPQESATRPSVATHAADPSGLEPLTTALTLTANEYLDARATAFREAELLGRVVYEPQHRLVRVFDPGLAAYLQGAPR